MKRLLAVVVVFVLAVPFAVAKETERTAILSLVITDAKGKHVPSLSKDELQIAIGGTQVPIESWEERGASAATGEVRRIGIVFDAQSFSPQTRRQAADALHGFLERTLHAGDLAVVLTIGQSAHVASRWTADLKELDEALARASSESTTMLAPQQSAAERRIRDVARTIQQARSSGALTSFDTLMEAARAYAAAAYRDAEQSLGSLDGTLSLFTPRTRNVLIVVGGGLPLRPGAGIFQYVESLRTTAERGAMGAQLQTGAARSAPMSESSLYDLTPLVHTFATRAWRRGVAVYTFVSDVDGNTPTRVEDTQVRDELSSFTGTATKMAGYRMMADETGGIAFAGTSASDAFGRVGDDLASFYAAGVHVTTPISGRQAVAVRTKNGYGVRVLRGNTSGGTPADEMEMRVIANQMVVPSDNALGIKLTASAPVPQPGERRLVTVDVQIPIRKLRLVPADGGAVTAAFTVFIATGDPSGHSSNVTRRRQEIRWPAAVANAAGERVLTFRVPVMLEPGRSQVSIGVMDETSQEKGFDRVSV